MRVAVVGAGLAGLICGRALQARGAIVTVFDKGRQPGGRLATRQVGRYAFNHGAPWLHEPMDELAPLRWGGGWVGPGSMAGLAAKLAGGLVQSGRHVAFLTHAAAGWTVLHRDARQTAPGAVGAEGVSAGPFDAVVLAIPAPQARGLLSAIGGNGEFLAGALHAVTMLPCLTLMAGFDRPAPQNQPDPFELGTLVHCSNRPGREPIPDCWTAHGTAGWSMLHLDDATDRPLATMQGWLRGPADQSGLPSYAALHRWRYARTGSPLGQPCLVGPNRLVLCGDWCLGSTTSDAIRSGQAAAAALI